MSELPDVPTVPVVPGAQRVRMVIGAWQLISLALVVMPVALGLTGQGGLTDAVALAGATMMLCATALSLTTARPAPGSADRFLLALSAAAAVLAAAAGLVAAGGLVAGGPFALAGDLLTVATLSAGTVLTARLFALAARMLSGNACAHAARELVAAFAFSAELYNHGAAGLARDAAAHAQAAAAKLPARI